MRDHRLTAVLTGGLLILGLLVLSSGGTTQADVSQAEVALEPHAYLPFVAKSYVQPRYPSDPDYPYQWALEQIDGPRAWSLSTGRDIVVAVIDTGVDLDHPDLSDKLVGNGRSFLMNAAGADDDNGHGTHVAGIIAASTDNAVGIAGLGWDTRVLPVKLLDEDGLGDPLLIDDAIYYATDQGAQVINLSLGVPNDCPSDVEAAVAYASSRGVVVVAAAGNHQEGSFGGIEMYPANCAHVLGVAATGIDDAIASFSNWGDHVSIVAPGSGIYSTWWPGADYREVYYSYLSGTSMAAPHVSGLAALVLDRYPSYTPDQVASAILDNAVDLGTSGWDPYFGCGRIDAFQTVLNGAQAAEPVCQRVTPSRETEAQPDIDAPYAPGEILVEFHASVDTGFMASQYTADAEFLPSRNAWRLHVPVGRERALLAQLRADPNVLQADLNYLAVIQN